MLWFEHIVGNPTQGNPIHTHTTYTTVPHHTANPRQLQLAYLQQECLGSEERAAEVVEDSSEKESEESRSLDLKQRSESGVIVSKETQRFLCMVNHW